MGPVELYKMLTDVFGPGAGYMSWDSSGEIRFVNWTTARNEYALEYNLNMSTCKPEYKFKYPGGVIVGDSVDKVIGTAVVQDVMKR